MDNSVDNLWTNSQTKTPSKYFHKHLKKARRVKRKIYKKSVEVIQLDSYDFFLMALTTNLPPQAYTRDTLVKAIEWLSCQPSSVRERANSADLVVSYYLQACRKAAVANEAPVSGENFKTDLKHLAQDLKQFEESSAPPQMGRLSAHLPVEEPPPLRIEPLRRLAETFPPPEPIFKPEPLPPRIEAAPKPLAWPVDARSTHAARELHQRLNLSSEMEALRMLVTLGAERARALFP